MKRFHVHVGVTDLDASVAFYSDLFGAQPSVARSDYAKWMLEDPRVNFAISKKCGAVKDVEHLGLQAENTDELSEVYSRLAQAGGPVLEEGATTCCYAQSKKNWITDPDGVVWETFLTTAEHTEYGNKEPVLNGIAQLANLEMMKTAKAEQSQSGSCCTPAV